MTRDETGIDSLFIKKTADADETPYLPNMIEAGDASIVYNTIANTIASTTARPTPSATHLMIFAFFSFF